MAWTQAPGPWHSQRTAHTQIAHQLAHEGPSPLNVEGLVDSFVGNAHGLFIREVDLQTVGNLLRRPAIDPFAVTTMRLVAADERSLLRPGDIPPSSIVDLALKAVLDILAQLQIGEQLRWLGSLGHQIGLPLRN
ncbi:hypothetical protein A6P55_25835 (plasmid) [Pandoraea pnomenusa]|nr:hypothetical protein A6P55_25450 [Pandoraea pnomenusa]ANC47731.1 hypothetical protein A6P55_25835 [Pandoraea pnomenusa]